MSLFKSMFKAPRPVDTGCAMPPPVDVPREEDFPTLWKSYFDEARDIPLRVGTPQEAVCIFFPSLF